MLALRAIIDRLAAHGEDHALRVLASRLNQLAFRAAPTGPAGGK
jgi:hypothetical protein